jgi:folate-binding protein YgfZ
MLNTTLSGSRATNQGTVADSQNQGETRAEFQALLSGCGVYDLCSRAKIRLTGSDRLRWLNGMVTNNIRDLATNHGVYCFLLNAQGHIQADLSAYNLGDSLLVDTDCSLRDKILAHFDHFIISDDVEVTDISSTLAAIGLAGPQAEAVLQAAGIRANEIAPLELTIPKCECECACLQCMLVRGDNSIGPSYEIWLKPEQRDSTWKALLAAGATAVGDPALDLLRVRYGIPRFGVDIRERDLPQETGQMRALNFTKGCYLGQEIVERIRSRGAVHRQFAAFLVEGPLPAAGGKIQADEKEVGEITSSANLPMPAGGRAVALGYLRREAMGRNLRACEATLKAVTPPFA